MSRRRTSLAVRISLLTVAVAVITAVVGGVLALQLIRKTSEDSGRHTLAQLAVAAATSSNQGSTARLSERNIERTLQAVRVQFAIFNSAATPVAGAKLARDALSHDEVQRVLTGASISARRTVDGKLLFIEARPTRDGAVVLIQQRSDALTIVDRAYRGLLWALAAAVVLAAILGLVVAYRLARPLRQTASAAHALADGHRDVAVDEQGPAEVAAVGAALNQLAAALSHSEARQREFLLSVSHDLRTPLTSITAYAESLADGVIAPDQAAHAGEVMLRESKRLNQLVADLLDLARLDAAEFRVDFALVDLTSIAADAAVVWQRRCDDAGVEFRLENAVEPVVVMTDGGRIRQVLDGLFDNALRVTPPGRPIVLAVRAESVAFDGIGAGSGVAEVRDGGPGLRDEDLPVAFDRSVLYDRYRAVRQSGTGLGLAIVAGLVRRLGGTVQAGHALEGGARFTVHLPLPPAHQT